MFTLNMPEQDLSYHVRTLDQHDTARKKAYQQLCAEIFVKQLHWDIPLKPDGRECDHYDFLEDKKVSIHCAYGTNGHDATEYLLGGIRIFQLRSWQNSMVMNEFSDAGMIPAQVLDLLERTYDAGDLLELTRFCVQRGCRYIPPPLLGSEIAGFESAIARDLIHSAAYSVAEKSNRRKAVALADTRYLQVMKRSYFAFETIYSRTMPMNQGYALIIIDLGATIRRIQAAGNRGRVERMLALCAKKEWIDEDQCCDIAHGSR